MWPSLILAALIPGSISFLAAHYVRGISFLLLCLVAAFSCVSAGFLFEGTLQNTILYISIGLWAFSILCSIFDANLILRQPHPEKAEELIKAAQLCYAALLRNDTSRACELAVALSKKAANEPGVWQLVSLCAEYDNNNTLKQQASRKQVTCLEHKRITPSS